MINEKETAETYIAIPAEEKYRGLAEGKQFGRATLEGILKRLTALQGYDEYRIQVIEIEE